MDTETEQETERGRYECARDDCQQRFETMGDKRRHMRQEHAS